MTQYIDKATVVAEIESKIEKYTKRGEESDARHDGKGMFWGGVLSCLNEIHTLVESMEQPSLPSNLEEAANEYAVDNASYWHENDDTAIETDADKLRDAFKAGAEWVVKQMKKHNP